MESKRSSIFILVFLLVILPFISYFFLQNGRNFFRSQYQEIAPKGILPAYIKSIKDSKGKEVWSQKDSLHLLLVGLVYPGENSDNIIAVQQLSNQFYDFFVKDRNGLTAPVEFLTFVNKELESNFTTDSLNESMRLVFSDEALLKAVGTNFGIITRDSGPRNFLILVDKVGRIRQIYLNFEQETLKNLFANMAILIPPEVKKDIILDRKKEL